MTAPLVLRLALAATAPPAGSVAIENAGEAPVRVWEPGNSWGDPALRFEVSSTRGDVRIDLLPQEYTRNVPASRELASGERQERDFDLGDGTWDIEDHTRRALAGTAQLTAVYEVPATPESAEHRVWVGLCRSEPVTIGQASV